jgi:hypothetical protein
MIHEYLISTTGTSTPAPEGNHAARLVCVIDLGVQIVPFGAKPQSKPQILLTFELVNEPKDDERNFVISKTVNATCGKRSALREAAEALLGNALGDQSLNVYSLLGKACMVEVAHTDKDGVTYANIKTISQIPKGMVVLEPLSPLLAYDTADPDDEVFEQLPEWIQAKVMAGQSRVPKAAAPLPAKVGIPAVADNNLPF